MRSSVAAWAGAIKAMLATIAFGVFYSNPAQADLGNAAAGAKWFPLCASCHGEHAEGNDALNSPRLQGTPPVYLERQLANFRSHRRGFDVSDTYGQQMSSMAAVLPDATATRDVAAYINTLTGGAQERRAVAGDIRNGRRAFEVCMPCHGKSGEGVAMTNAPPIAGQSPEYLLRQLKAFQAGWRGVDAADTDGRTMGAIAKTLKGRTLLSDLAGFISTLPYASAAIDPKVPPEITRHSQ